MAKAAKTTSKKRSGPAKARKSSGGKQRSGSKTGAAKKRRATRKSESPSATSASWLTALSTLAGSAPGREIIADVLEAAASALRKSGTRIGQAVVSRAQQGIQAAGTAAEVAAEVATGTVGLAQTAASVLAEVATDAARSMLPGAAGGDDEAGRSGSSRGAKGRSKP